MDINMNNNTAVKEKIQIVLERLFETRGKAETILIPFIKNTSRYVGKGLWYEKEIVDLNQVFPMANDGDVSGISFNLSTKEESALCIKTLDSAKVYFDGKLIYPIDRDDLIFNTDKDGYRYVHIPITVDNTFKRADILCERKKGCFSVRYVVSSKVYPFMWAKDYLNHVRITVPMDEYKGEEGIAILDLSVNGEYNNNKTYIFPKKTTYNANKNFAKIVDNPKTYVGYAYSEAKSEGKLHIVNHSPIKVIIDGECVYKSEKIGEFDLFLHENDTILIKSVKQNDKWGFECDDELLECKKIYSNRNYGDKWLMIGGFGCTADLELKYGPEIDLSFEQLYHNQFGDSLFWRFADGSYIRPEIDSYFFGQWFYAIMLGHWGIKKVAEFADNESCQKYFLDSMSMIVKWFDYMKYDYNNLHVLTPFLQRSMLLNDLDSIGTIGMNLCDEYLTSSNPKTLTVINSLKTALYENIPRMENGIINRVQTMWADDLFMGIPFIVRLGRVFDDEKYYDDAFLQLNEYFKKMYIEEDDLFSHIFYVEDYEKSNVPWGRGNGWVVVAMCEYLDLVPQDNKNYDNVKKLLHKLLSGIMIHQGKNGLWHQVINQKESYEETSCTAMFLYGLCKAVQFNIFAVEEVKNVIEAAYKGLCLKSIKTDGTIVGVCKGSGCSKNWTDYNLLGTVENDDHGTGIVLAALCEWARIVEVYE